MFLVLLRHTMDDLPIKLLSTRDEAERFAATVEEMPTDGIRHSFHTDCSTPVNVSIVEFDEHGDPLGMTLQKQFND